MNIVINKNNIEEKIIDYQIRTGATKTWIANRLEMSPQRLYQLFKANSMTVDIAIKFAEFLNCDVKELFDYNVVE